MHDYPEVGPEEGDLDRIVLWRNHKNQTALYVAVFDKNYQLVLKLLKRAPYFINERCDYSFTALMVGAMTGDREIFKLLLSVDAPLDDKSKEGFTALIMAAGMGNCGVVKLLLEARADLEIKDNKGNTALMMAAEMGQHAVVKLLLNGGAIYNVKNNQGFTALMLAAGQGHLRVVKSLLKAGANKDEVAENGETALSLATQNNHIDVIVCLAKHGGFQQRLNHIGFSDVPDEFKCPISEQIMNDPVLAPNKVVYDRGSLALLFNKSVGLPPVSPEIDLEFRKRVVGYPSEVMRRQAIGAFVAQKEEEWLKKSQNGTAVLVAQHGVFKTKMASTAASSSSSPARPSRNQ